MSHQEIDALRARVAELASEAQLREQVTRLEKRIRNGISPGSPASHKIKQPKQAIAGGGGDWDRLRDEFIRRGNYEPL